MACSSKVAGDDLTIKSKVLETGAGLTQVRQETSPQLYTN